MLGGGTFTKQDKVLPGSYINFVSLAKAASMLSERGYAALPMVLDWGPSQEVFAVGGEYLEEDCKKIFGYEYKDEKMKGIRDIFRNVKTLYVYRLNQGEAAENLMATARYSGVRGNDITLTVEKDGELFVVTTYLAGKETDSQAVAGAGDLLDNDYVIFKKDGELKETAGLPLTGGTNGDAPGITEYQDFLDASESLSFNALGCLSNDEEIKDLFIQHTRRMRDEMGAKFQTVLYQASQADYEGIVSVENAPAEAKASGKAAGEQEEPALETWSMVYWVTGAIAGCGVNASNTNKTYDGEFNVNTVYTQRQLKEALLSGKFMFHKVGDEVRVLEDINTLVTYTEEKNRDFASNQTVRVLDQIGNDVAVLFDNKYLGKIPNDEAGRISFWNDLVTYFNDLSRLRAIEGFEAKDVIVTKGEGKKSVVVNCPVTPVNAMAQLYMTVIVQ